MPIYFPNHNTWEQLNVLFLRDNHDKIFDKIEINAYFFHIKEIISYQEILLPNFPI
jgi:hypothetical protein